MPALNIIKPLGWAVFMSKGHKMPPNPGFAPPKDAQQYVDGITMPMWGGAPAGLPFFTPQIAHEYHSSSANDTGKWFKQFHDAALDAVKFAHTMWKVQAKFKDLKIMALSAIGTPGCLDGPELESFIKMAPSMAKYFQGNAKEYRDAVAKGVSAQFKKWQDKVTVPGLPWYPAFVAFPSAMAPPMPNIPMPLITCPSAMMAEITVPMKLKKAMVDALKQKVKDEDPDKQHETLFEAIATALAMAFMIWLPSQMVMMVMGKGPIPSFAPPYVPVGPVVNGDNLPIPGHLAM